MHTFAVWQLTLPHTVPSGASSVPQPPDGSHFATWHGSLGAGQLEVASWCTQPWSGSQASVVHALPSSQDFGAPTQAPASQWPPSMHGLSEQDVPSAAGLIAQLPLAGSNVESRHPDGLTHAGGTAPSPSSVTVQA